MKALEKQKKLMLCPICDKTHYVDVCEMPSHVLIHGTNVDYMAIEFYCKNRDTYFANGKLVDGNLQRAREAYVAKA